ncbi:MAG: ABC transporter permease, partial [Deltaproteobacteria bacterium]|nr:ABC transporter permease [Deltaproteobacteria bacterium]
MTNKEILRRLLHAISPYKTKLIISMIGMVFVALFTGAQTYLVKDLLDKIFFEKNEDYLHILTIIIVVIFGIKGVCYYVYNFLLEQVGLSVIKDFRARVFQHIHIQPLSFFNEYPTGTLISRVISDVTLMQQAVSNSLVGILRDFFSIIVLMGVVFFLNWKLALFSLAVLPVAAFPIVKFGKIFRKLSTKAQEETAQVSNMLYETIT